MRNPPFLRPFSVERGVDERERSRQHPTGADTIHMDGDQIIMEVQETDFLSNSDVTVHNITLHGPDSIIIQDAIENVLIEDVNFSCILEETDICDNVIIPEQVLDVDITEEVSLAQFPIPDISPPNITSTSLTMPECVLMSNAIHVSDMEVIEHVAHDSVVEAEVITDPLLADISEIEVADYASETILDSSGMPLEQQDDTKINHQDALMISLNVTGKTDHAGSTDITIHAESETDPYRWGDTCPEDTNVYTFKGDPAGDDLGPTIDIVESESNNDYGVDLHDQNSSIHIPRDNMVCMAFNDSQQEDKDCNVVEMTNGVDMEVIVADDGTAAAATVHGQQMDGSEMSAAFMPIAWAAAYDNNSGEIENQRVTSSALLALDESGDLDILPKRKSKEKRTESRHCPTEIAFGPDPCMFCGKKFPSKRFLKRHMKKHPEHLASKKYHCTDCGYSTNKKKHLHNHQESHKLTSKAGKDTECHECGNHVTHGGALCTHKTMHGKKEARKTYKCKFCDYESDEQVLLNHHLLAVHRKKFPHICVECGKGFRHPSDLKKHIQVHTGEKPYEYQYCEYKSSESSKLERHIKTKHNREIPFKCGICILTFSDTKEAKKHALTHQEAKTYQCLHCNYKNSNSRNLKRHVISVHTKDYPHKCEMCSKGFHRPSDLKRHEATHQSKILHQCRHCDFKSPDPFVLSSHILSVHTKSVPFKCEKCNRGFQRQCELQNHLKTHSCCKVYQCEYCDYSTVHSSDFKRHVISIHTKDYPHYCEYCQKGFRRPSEKNQHILKHHEDIVLPQQCIS
ncbi:hypothetical protein STEG23_025666 [Scotinomys teguina]